MTISIPKEWGEKQISLQEVTNILTYKWHKCEGSTQLATWVARWVKLGKNRVRINFRPTLRYWYENSNHFIKLPSVLFHTATCTISEYILNLHQLHTLSDLWSPKVRLFQNLTFIYGQLWVAIATKIYVWHEFWLHILNLHHKYSILVKFLAHRIRTDRDMALQSWENFRRILIWEQNSTYGGVTKTAITSKPVNHFN